MIQKPIESIDESDLLNLITDSVFEKKTLDYKVSFSGNSDEDKREFLKDITSFANSSGGDIIYGIKEENGVPVELVGIPNEEVDAKIRWIEDLVRQAVQPRIPGIKIQPIDLGENLAALIIRIPKSWRNPHCVTFKNWSRFFARSSNGVYQLDVDELRNAFILSDTLNERIRRFREDRISNLVVDEGHFRMGNKSKAVVHIIPINSFDTAKKYNIDSIHKIYNQIQGSNVPYPLACSNCDYRINFDGFSLYSAIDRTGTCDTYLQIYNNGIIEAVTTRLFAIERQCIPIVNFEKNIIKGIEQYLKFLEKIGVELPCFIYVSLLGVNGYRIYNDRLWSYEAHLIDRDVLMPIEIFIEDYNTEITSALRPIFDSIWNAGGYLRSFNYREDGTYAP